jgi:hypothetical protein
VARAVLAVGAVLWLVAGVAAFLVAGFGGGWLLSILPPLTVGSDGLARAVAAIGVAVAAVGVAHVVALSALRRAVRWGYSFAVLLAALLAAALLSGAAAAMTVAAADPRAAAASVGTGVVASVAAAGYGVAAARLVGEMRARRSI